jgi:hypothetical protein
MAPAEANISDAIPAVSMMSYASSWKDKAYHCRAKRGLVVVMAMATIESTPAVGILVLHAYRV